MSQSRHASRQPLLSSGLLRRNCSTAEPKHEANEYDDKKQKGRRAAVWRQVFQGNAAHGKTGTRGGNDPYALKNGSHRRKDKGSQWALVDENALRLCAGRQGTGWIRHPAAACASG